MGRKGISLEEYIRIKTITGVAKDINVSKASVSHWVQYYSSPRPVVAAKLIETSNGLLTWASIYQPYINQIKSKQLEFQFNDHE